VNNLRFQKIIGQGKLVLVDFYTPWCIPCKEVKPILKDLKKEYKTALRIVSADADKNPFLAAKYNIVNIPTFILFKEGKVVWAGQGVIPLFRMREIVSGNI
jgi:thioredoxin 1